MPKLSQVSQKCEVKSAKCKVILIIAFLLITYHLSLITSPILAAPGDPPNPMPCKNPIPTDNLTDNYITDENGDPPGPEGVDNVEALKFSYAITGAVGETVTREKNIEFPVDFSKLQAIFAASNSDYLEGQFQDNSHSQTNLLGLTNTNLMKFQGPIDKTAPKVMTDQLRTKFVEKIWEKPEMAESKNSFTDNNGLNPKTIYDLVKAYSLPKPPEAADDKTQWLNTWGKYWVKIPTAYNEFAEGKLEFRAIASKPLIQKVKNGEICPRPIRTVAFPVPNFFRTAAISEQLNKVIIPKSAQSPTNNLILGGILGVKDTIGSIFQNCVKIVTNNPFTNALKKTVKISLEKLDPAPPAYAAASCTLSKSSVVAGGTVRVTSVEGLSGSIGMVGYYGSPIYSALGNLSANGSRTITVPSDATAGLYVVRVGGYAVACTPNISVTAAPTPTPTPTPIPGCTLSTSSVIDGGTVTVTSVNSLSGTIGMVGYYGSPIYSALGTLPANGNINITVPTGATAGLYVVRVGGYAVACTPNISVEAAPSPACSFSPGFVNAGDNVTVTSINSLSGEIRISGALWDPDVTPSIFLGNLTANSTQTVTIPSSFASGIYVIRVGGYGVTCKTPAGGDLDVTAATPSCSYTPEVVQAGDPITVTSHYGLTGEIRIKGALWPIDTPSVLLGNLPANGTQTVTIPSTFASGTYVIRVGGYGVTCKTSTGGDLNVTAAPAPTCEFSPSSVFPGENIAVTSINGLFGDIRMKGALTPITEPSIYLGSMTPNNTTSVKIPNVPPGIYAVRVGLYGVRCVNPPNNDLEIKEKLDAWTVYPLQDVACVKYNPTGKAGGAPYCAIYPIDTAGNPNILPGDTCNNQNDSNKLNSDSGNVICTFKFKWAGTFTIPTAEEGDGQWDSCTPVAGGQRTCYLTVGVWPDFRIPFLCEIWNSTLYSDNNEPCQTLQETGKPGVYTFFTPKAAQEELAKDPIQVMIDKCNADPTLTGGCKDLLDWGATHSSQYPGFADCVGAALLDTAKLIKCFDLVAHSIVGKNLPGEANTSTLGVKTNVLGVTSNDDQKQRLIGGVDCSKHFTRDIALKPKVLQESLGIKQNCDLTASETISPGGGPTPTPIATPPAGGTGCDGSGNFASLLPNPIPPSVGAVSPDIFSHLDSSTVINAAKYGSTKSTTACEILIGLHYVEASWYDTRSFISGTTLGNAEPQVPNNPDSCTAYGGTITSSGCTFSRLEDTAYYAGDHIKDKMALLFGAWRPPANFAEMVGAMSWYNGGGNANCGETVPYSGPCPPPVGIDDIYTVSHFDSAHAQMYLIYCADEVKCPTPQLFTRDGAATAAKEFYLK